MGKGWARMTAILWGFGFATGSVLGASEPTIVFLIHEDEYDTKTTLPRFAQDQLVKPFGWKCIYLLGQGENDFHDLSPIAEADLLVVSVRRKFPKKEDLGLIRAYCESGKPIVGIRTASHAFASRDGALPEGRSAWPEFDRDVLGGNYHNHHGNKNSDDPKTYVRVIDEASGHPLLQGVRRDEFVVRSWLYKVLPLADTATPLLMGRVGDRVPHEPVAWTNVAKYGNRVFYTSLGHPEDFEIPDFRRLLINGVRWCLGAP